MGFYASNKNRHRQAEAASTATSLDSWYNELLHGSSETGETAVIRLIQAGSEKHLLAALNSPRPTVTESAAYGLMECWISEAGIPARELLEKGSSALDEFRYEDAEQIFLTLIVAYPDWAEPIHQLAQLRYYEEKNLESIRLHRRALRLKPHHFSAWHGVALNAVELGRWSLARDAARAALAIHGSNRACQAILSQALSRLA